MADATTRPVFLVVCGHWSYNDEFETGDDAPVKAFTSRERAEAYIRAWEGYYDTRQGSSELGRSQSTVRYSIIETEVEA